MNSYLRILLSLGKYLKGEKTALLRDKLAEIISEQSDYFLFENGRSALYVFLKSLDLDAKSEVAVVGFTCAAAVNPIIWAGLTPLYIDIDSQNLSMSLEDLNDKYSKNLKVLIVQHTFGIPADIAEICSWAKERDIVVIEDCAHSLGVNFEGQTLGTYGDAGMFSFGLEKVLSSRAGGALAINNKSLSPAISKLHDDCDLVNFKDTFLWLINPLIWRIIRLIGVQKGFLPRLLRKIGLLNMGFSPEELEGKKNPKYPRKISNALAAVVLDQLEDLKKNLVHRQQITRTYFDNLKKNESIKLVQKVKSHSGLIKVAFAKNVAERKKHFFANDMVDNSHVNFFPLVRFPLILKDYEVRSKVQRRLKQLGVAMDPWYDPVIYPANANMEALGYEKGMCPRAESVSRRIINLPTHLGIDVEVAQKISDVVLTNITD